MVMKMFRFLTKDELKKVVAGEVIKNDKPIIFFPYYPYQYFNIMDFMKLINERVIKDSHNVMNTLCINKMDYLVGFVPKNNKDEVKDKTGVCKDMFSIYDRDDLERHTRRIKSMLDLDEEILYHYYTMKEYSLKNMWLHDILDISGLKIQDGNYDRVTYRRLIKRTIPNEYFLVVKDVIEKL